VAGEGIFEALSSNAETTLRAHDEQVLGDTISKAGDAADAATRANTAATGAETKAKAAGEKSAQAENSAATALVTARNARREADSFEAKIASAETKAADAESHLAESLERANSAEKESIRLRDILGGWQLDEDAKKLFAIDTQGFLGTPFDLAVNPNEASFMEELDGILTSPSVGWVRLPPKDTSGTGVTMLIDGKASDHSIGDGAPRRTASRHHKFASGSTGIVGEKNPHHYWEETVASPAKQIACQTLTLWK
jgi:hypothetical protein